MNESSDVEKFKSFLKEIFRIDLQDLDFGIYKIMKIKQDMIQKFIDDDLIRVADTVISEFPDKDQNLMTDVFNLSYEFLSRYYSNGDFIPQIRYGGRDKYMIPYNGQEVELYWATRNSYYVKTTEYFTNYSFIVYDPFNPDDKFKVNFKIKEADLDKNYVASEKKYFFIDDNPISINDKEIDIFFNYRPTREDENENFKGNENTIKDFVNQKSEKAILNAVPKDLREILSRKNAENESGRSVIRRHIDIYSKKNDSDYFIVKNLKAFLNSELDIFIKNEILIFDAEFKIPERNLYLAKAILTLCKNIIEQMSQIEDFERILWEKKKFVYNVNYVITLDRIANKTNGIEIIKGLLNHTGIKNQLNEWIDLGLIESGFDKKNIIQSKVDGQMLNEKYKFLPIDTRYFEEIQNDILSLFDDLDNDLDGWLIHSENYQALNTILPKYKEKIQTIYIDPPFNKEQNADYLYNVRYKDSTWATMLENRLEIAKHFLNDTGSIFVRCDYNGNWILRPLMNDIFDKNYRNEIIINRTKKIFTGVNGYNVAIDSLFFYSKRENFLFCSQYKLRTKDQKWLNMHSPGERNPPERIIFDMVMYPPKGRHWTFIQEKIDDLIKEDRIRINKRIEYIDLSGNKISGMPQYLTGEEELLDSNWTDIPGYSQTQNFSTENSEILLKRVIESTSNEKDLILDFFLGSGTTATVAHKIHRKWLGIEMGEHFYTVVLPRMKKVLAYDKSGISKEKDVREGYNENSSGGFFKYYDLEQYEDSLNNIKVREQQNYEKIKPHLIEYILNYGTSGSAVFINKEMLSDLFNVKMKIVNGGMEKEATMDLIETFNLWYGVNVEKVVSVDDRDRRYVFIKGRKDRQGVIIIWRNTKDLDFIAEKDFIMEKLRKDFNIEDDSQGFTQVLFNNDCALDLSVNNIEVKSLDPIFFELQWDGLSAE